MDLFVNPEAAVNPETVVNPEPSRGKVYLVGAGPGELRHLTLAAQDCLRQGEVLVYDALADDRLHSLVSPTCQLIQVGKRGGQPSTPQAEINALLVDHCRRGQQVVRLKSGDPFIFGRALAEIQALTGANCAFEVIPGLSSALTAPLLAGIPLTDPVLSRGFGVFTAHDPDALNWAAIAAIDTLVFLMGGQQLEEIIRQLLRHHRSQHTPIALIRWASQPQQQVWTGTLLTLVQTLGRTPRSPCVIVVGEVVRLREFMGG
ncbi:uroporphyrinogen-III C-methyltransferase [Prochlorothrix hollandica]|uniref:uroporphyrinogen-III C-methyltransferase n=1 Tax=Prochlorothrix hollandica TaxID=1223 RepID=UPI001F31EB73|nr:uroporphyrinogen-III C-methyltransferase [Prochlorothrix hollandica]